MKDGSKLHRQTLRLVAAAVLVALGSPLAAQEREPVPGQEAAPQQQQQDERFGREQRDDERFGQDRHDDQRDAGAAAIDGQFGDGLAQLERDHENLSSFVKAVRAAGMEESLTSGATTYTVFAPTNEAFDEKGPDHEQLSESENWQETAELLRAHIVADDVDPDMARRLGEVLTLDGGTISVTERDGELMADNARVVEQDIRIGNMRVHVIDSVLEPSPGRIDIATRDRVEDDDWQDDSPELRRDDDAGFGDGRGLN